MVNIIQAAFGIIVGDFEARYGKRAPSITLKLLRSQGTEGAPCWLWNALASQAYADGSDYFYQTNDDIELDTECWTERFVDELLQGSSVAPNFGIVGPRDGNNEAVMTQSFVHRTHLEVFGGHFYPPVFRNWYSDNWAGRVYGQCGTL